jgi:ADP-heptose:LPS heptosyltransferase
MIDNMHRIPVFIAAGSVNLRELAAIFSCADLVVTNSTGPLHLAVALEVSTVSIYSPIPTCHPTRWGPYPDYVEEKKGHFVLVAPLVGDGTTAQEDIAAVTVEKVCQFCQASLARKGVRAGTISA